MTTKLDLQDDQKFALMKFRRNIADIIKPEHDDYFLLRWLRARSWNPEQAEKMIRETVKWRERWGADTIETWKPPQVIVDYTPYGLSGFDKEGAPVIVVPFAGMDMWGLLHTVSRGDVIRNTLQILEKHMKICYEQSKIHGPNAREVVVIFDMEGFNLKQYTWRPASEVVISLIKAYEANYPEILKCCYIINAPRVFAFAFSIVKKFLNAYTLSKIQIYKSDQKKWLPKILEKVDISQVPLFYGGTMTGENGDPKCSNKINWGGKVPKSMYSDKNENTDNGDSFIEDVIKNGSRIKLEFVCADAGCFLKWEFRTFDHDIKFGVKCINEKSGEETIEIPLKKVASHQLDEMGFITCQPDCKYSVVFDNRNSYMTNKKIRYSVGLTTPLSELENGANEIIE